jgi:hypothetical protein
MLRIRFAKLLRALVLTFGIHPLYAATVTHAVGTCRPKLPSYASISAALAATPAPNIVMVCPGTYNEQVQITQAVTLEGVSTANSAQAIIAVPSGGLVTNATNDFGEAIAAQLWVNNATGPVDVIDITLDAAGNGITTFPPFIVGVFYQNSSGTVNRVTTRNQKGNGSGEGIYVEGGSGNPSVTVEDSSIHDFDAVGIDIETSSNASEVTATIKGNSVNGGTGQIGDGILANSGATSTVTANLVTGTIQGIYTQGLAAGSISGNTLMNNLVGIAAGADGVSVTGNKISAGSSLPYYYPYEGGIVVFSDVETITGNSIFGAPVGIEFGCSTDPNVHSNTIIDASVGLDEVPTGITATNSYFNVGTIRTGGC